MLTLTLALAQHGDEYSRHLLRSEPFELYANFDISRLIRPEMNWYELLDIRQQLRRPSLAFYVDKVRYKSRMKEIGVDIPEIYYVYNVDMEVCGTDVCEDTFQGIEQSIKQALAGRTEYVAKPTHMSCSDGVFVVKEGWNIYPRSPEPVQPAQVAATLANALQGRSSLLGESWALHQVPPGVVVEERISAGGEDTTAALEFKTIVIWGAVWAADVRRGTYAVQVLGRDGSGLLGEPRHPSLARVDWPRVRRLAERLGAHKDCFRVDIFVSPASPAGMRYQVSEVEFYITSSMPLFDEAAKLWLDGYYSKKYVLIPNHEVSGPYANMQDPDAREEQILFEGLKSELGWTESILESGSRNWGSLARRPGADATEDVVSLGRLGQHRNASAMQS